MSKKFFIYSRSNPPCPYCEGAKMLAGTKGVSHHIIDIGKDIQMDEFTEMFPDQRTVPLILVEEDGLRSQIGGYTEFKKYLDTQDITEGLTL